MRVLLVAGLAAVALLVLPFLQPIHQSLDYHMFADRRTLWGVPNFWNVVSNLAFLPVAAWGWRALHSPSAFLETWERTAYRILLVGVALVTLGSGYYHWSPNNATLFWDRLPMTIAFMALLATTVGERIRMKAGRMLLFPLLALGAASVLYWRFSDDLRLYAVVQFYPMLAIPLMLLLFPPRYTGTVGIFAMIALYGAAKLLELFDYQLAASGHAWKHVAAAAAILCYVVTVEHRRRMWGGPPGPQPAPGRLVRSGSPAKLNLHP